MPSDHPAASPGPTDRGRDRPFLIPHHRGACTGRGPARRRPGSRDRRRGVARAETADRKSTRLNSSHVKISYAVFCLKKKKKNYAETANTNNISTRCI